jgi:glycosyltransferase involved in cell wall biosynthesis
MPALSAIPPAMPALVGKAVRRVLIAASDSGAGLAGMRVQSFELGTRVAAKLVEAGFGVKVALRADDEEFADGARAAGAEVLALPVGRTPLDRLLGFYRGLGPALADADLLYSLNPKIPFGAIGRCRTAITIHDFCYLEFPSEFDRLRRTYHWLNQRYLLPRVDCVFTVSRDAAQKVRRFFPQVQEAKIHVAPNGVSSRLDPVKRPDDLSVLRERFGLDGPYFVFLGKLSPRKNLRLAVEGLRRLNERGVAATLLLVGPPGWRESEDLQFVEQAGVGPLVKRVSFLEAPVLSAVLRRSAGLLYPSRCEGFGMPALEGILMGVPVVVAAGTVCAENAGPFALQVDPDDGEAMARIMERLVVDPAGPMDPTAVADHLVAYDWNRSATIVAAQLERLLTAQGCPTPVGFSNACPSCGKAGD